MANEKRLIDVDKLKSWTCKWCNATRPDEPCEPCDCAIMLFYDGLNTVDAVEVVRCKDCKHRAVAKITGEYFCVNPYYGMGSGVELKDDDFCSYGERKES